MKNATRLLILLTLILGTAFGARAQVKSTVTVFTKDGERFWVMVDGAKQNEKPKSRVEVKNLSPTVNYRFRIVFENTNFPAIDKDVIASNLDGPVDLEYVLRKKKKKYTMKVNRWYRVETNTADNNNTGSGTQTNGNSGNGTSTTQSTTTTTVSTTTTSGKGNGTGVITVNEKNKGNIIVIDPSGNNTTVATTTKGNSTSSTTTTTTTTTSTTTTTTNTGNTGNTTTSGCSVAMSTADFNQALASIKKQSFADDKLKIARQIAKSNCVSAEQVKRIMGEFSFESNKLDFAKYAYDSTMDKNNYHIINDAFGFSSSVDELNEYLEGKK